MTTLRHFRNLIDGEPCDARSGETIEVIDPSDGQAFATIPRGDAADIDAAAQAAHAAFHDPWRRTTAFDRGRILSRLAALVLARQDELAELECRDTGKPLTQAKRDIELLARYEAGQAFVNGYGAAVASRCRSVV